MDGKNGHMIEQTNE